ncbi:putative integral membrane protein [Corynebacterium jeikeium]|uniref:Putative membrane protein n=1 Tax=Corynebacterium jeikeium (strain K411) TaxID=306537 RepID=Q4JU37_CORJK|nr:putative membrane protein [Corynebacterium jeikeium K411]SUY84985.1 putative integral membrane protein [Corynebacterium jeikeium]
MKQVFGLLRAVRNARTGSAKSSPDQQRHQESGASSGSSVPSKPSAASKPSEEKKPAPAKPEPKKTAPAKPAQQASAPKKPAEGKTSEEKKPAPVKQEPKKATSKEPTRSPIKLSAGGPPKAPSAPKPPKASSQKQEPRKASTASQDPKKSTTAAKALKADKNKKQTSAPPKKKAATPRPAAAAPAIKLGNVGAPPAPGVAPGVARKAPIPAKASAAKPAPKQAAKPVSKEAAKPVAKETPAAKATPPAKPKPEQKPAPKKAPKKATQPKAEQKTVTVPAAKQAPKPVAKAKPKTVPPAAEKSASQPKKQPEAKQVTTAQPAPQQTSAPRRNNVPEALTIPPENKTVKKDRRARLRQVKGLDGLRGLAVLAVVIYHFFGDILPGGYLGVDLFFVLSGFLITSLLVREYRVNNTISLKDFWIRRFRRILPAALVTLFIVTAIVTAIGGDIAVGIREQFLGTLFFVNNWTQIATSQSYFSENEIQVFAHYWSLAVEEQFYIIWPLVTLGIFVFTQRRLRRSPRRIPMLVTAVLAVLSAAIMALLFTPGEDPTRVYYGTDTHAFGLLIGAFLSLAVTSTRNDPRVDSWPSAGKFEARAAGAIGALALVGYVFQLLLMGDDLAVTYRGGLLLTSVLGVLMIWGVIRETGPLTIIFRTNVMRWLGQRSFSLYLWHWPVIMILRALFDADGHMDHKWILGLVAVPIALVISEISYQHVENPFRRRGYKQTWKDYWSSRPTYHEINEGFKKVAWPVVPLLVVACAGGVIYGVVNSNDKTALEQELDQLQRMNQQANKGNAPAPATPPPPKEEKAAAVQGKDITAVGDSVMLAASEALNTSYPGIYIDADVSRHYTAGMDVLRQLNDSGKLRKNVFLGFGTNGPAFPDQLEEMINLIGPDRQIFMAMPYGDREWMAQSRQDVLDAAKTHDNVYIADWCGHAQAHQNMLFEDGVHPMPEGAQEYAKAFDEALAQAADHKKKTTTTCA